MKKKLLQWKFIIIVSLITAAIGSIGMNYKDEILKVFKRTKNIA